MDQARSTDAATAANQAQKALKDHQPSQPLDWHDRSLLEAALRLTPRERVLRAQKFAQNVGKLRNADRVS